MPLREPPGGGEQRLALTERGEVHVQLKSAYRDGTTQILLEPLDFLARLAALVPPPRAHLSFRSSGYLRRYSQRSSPVTPSIACVMSFGFGKNITPSCTSGVPSCMPSARGRVQTSRRCATSGTDNSRTTLRRFAVSMEGTRLARACKRLHDARLRVCWRTEPNKGDRRAREGTPEQSPVPATTSTQTTRAIGRRPVPSICNCSVEGVRHETDPTGRDARAVRAAGRACRARRADRNVARGRRAHRLHAARTRSCPANFTGVLDPIFVRTVVLDNGSTRAALVAIDAGAMPPTVQEGQRARGGGAEDPRQPAADVGEPYAQRAVQARRQRRGDHPAQPARGRRAGCSRRAWRAAPVSRYINVNRDRIDPKTNRWWEGPNYNGTSDKTVAVVRIETPSGKPIAVYYNYAVHGGHHRQARHDQRRHSGRGVALRGGVARRRCRGAVDQRRGRRPEPDLLQPDLRAARHPHRGLRQARRGHQQCHAARRAGHGSQQSAGDSC